MDNRKPLDGLIFDLDGTLWSTAETCARAWNAAQKTVPEAGFRAFAPADVEAVTGLVQTEIFRVLFPDLEAGMRERVGAACVHFEDEFLDREGGRLYPGVPEGLLALKAAMPLAIVSNCQVGYIERFLRMHQLEGLFCDHECHGNTGLKKRDNLLALVGRRGWKSVAYVGDTLTDASSAREASVPFYWVTYGFGKDVPAEASFSSFPDLVSYFCSPGSSSQGVAHRGDAIRS